MAQQVRYSPRAIRCIDAEMEEKQLDRYSPEAIEAIDAEAEEEYVKIIGEVKEEEEQPVVASPKV